MRERVLTPPVAPAGGDRGNPAGSGIAGEGSEGSEGGKGSKGSVGECGGGVGRVCFAKRTLAEIGATAAHVGNA